MDLDPALAVGAGAAAPGELAGAGLVELGGEAIFLLGAAGEGVAGVVQLGVERLFVFHVVLDLGFEALKLGLGLGGGGHGLGDGVHDVEGGRGVDRAVVSFVLEKLLVSVCLVA